MPGIGSGLGAEVDDSTGELAPLGTKIVVLHLEFPYGILVGGDQRQVDVADVEGLAVEILRALVTKGSADLIVAKIERIPAHDGAARVPLRNHGRGQKRQVENVAAIQRKFVGLARVDYLT